MDATYIDLTVRLSLALILGGAIGIEREYRAKEAGFRTHFLVALGSALFCVVSLPHWRGIMVGIQHICLCILRYAQDAVQSEHTHLQGLVLGVYENEFMRHGLGYAPQSLCRSERHTRKHGHACKRFTAAEWFYRYWNIFARHGRHKTLDAWHNISIAAQEAASLSSEIRIRN